MFFVLCQHHKSLNYHELSNNVGEHDDKMVFEHGVLIEAHVEQGGIGDEEQHCAYKGNNSCLAGEGDKLEQCKAVHRAVDKQIDKHGVEKLLRKMRLKAFEYQA